MGTGDRILIQGFAVSGSGSETLLIRGAGPSLARFGVTGTLAQPTLTVFDASGRVLASNTGWADDSQVAEAAAVVGAFPFPAGSADCALLIHLEPGAYTVEIAGAAGTTGVALAELYEVASNGTRLANISTRAYVGTGSDILIPGFVISGTGSERLLVRGDGPALGAFGVPDVLAQTSIALFSGAQEMARNTGWSTDPDAPEILAQAAAVGAFALAADSADSALVTSLAAGPYTLQVTGVDGGEGEALAEVYEAR